MKKVISKEKVVLFLISVFVTSTTVFAQETTILDPKGPGGYSITSFDRVGQRAVGGYMDTEFIAAENQASTFRAHRYILDVTSQVSDKVLVNSEIELEYGANVANDGVIKIEQAWVDYEINETVSHRTGIIVVPFGRVNVLHDSDVRDATQRPLYAKYLIPTTWVEVGTGIHGNVSFSDIEINYQGYFINGFNENISAATGFKSARPSLKTDNNGDKAFVGRLGISPMLGLEIGGSVYNGKFSDGGTDGALLVGTDFFYKLGQYEAVAEAAIARIDKNGSIPERMLGGYLELRAHVLQKQLKSWIPSLRSPVITVFGRVGHVDTDRANKYITNRVMVGFNFRPIESTVYKFEYQIEEYDKPSDDSSVGTFLASVAVGF